MRSFDTYAAEFIPIRLMLSIAIVAAISGLLAVGYTNFSVTNTEHQVENQWLSLQSELYSLLGSGVARDVDVPGDSAGTKRVYTFDLPDNLVYLAFGVDPDTDNNGMLQTGLTEEGAVLCYKVEGGSKHIKWLDDQFCFREGLLGNGEWDLVNQGFILDSSGVSTLTFELVQQQGKQYLLIHSSDSYT